MHVPGCPANVRDCVFLYSTCGCLPTSQVARNLVKTRFNRVQSKLGVSQTNTKNMKYHRKDLAFPPSTLIFRIIFLLLEIQGILERVNF